MKAAQHLVDQGILLAVALRSSAHTRFVLMRSMHLDDGLAFDRTIGLDLHHGAGVRAVARGVGGRCVHHFSGGGDERGLARNPKRHHPDRRELGRGAQEGRPGRY